MESQSVSEIVSQIDAVIRNGLWFDFHILTYDGSTLTVAGGIDLVHAHELEIKFQDVFFVSAFFSEWRSDTKKIVFSLPEDSRDYNERFEIETGYTLFRFKTDDYKNDVWIACKSISYNCDSVFYYQREDLKPGQRVFIRPSA